MRINRPDFRQVAATAEEVEEYRTRTKKRYGYDPVTPAVPRAEHKACGKRIWYSGIGIGSHLRSCKA